MFKILLFCALLASVFSKPLPEGFPTCSRDDPNINTCIMKASETIRPMLEKGIPSLNIPSIKNLVIPEVVLQQGSEAINVKAILKNIVVKGLENYQVEKGSYDKNTHKVAFTVKMPKVDLEGDHTIKGRILVAPLEGAGKFTASIANVLVNFDQENSIAQKKGQEYLKSESTDIKLVSDTPKLHLDGLFPNDPQLAQAASTLIDENGEHLFNDIKPALEQVLENLIEKLILRPLQNDVPYDVLLPPKA